LPARFQAPPAADPPAKLTHTAGVRFSEEHFEALEAHAIACGMPVSRYVRQVILGVKPIARRPLAHSAIVAVNRVGTNLNQLVHLANSGTVLTPELLAIIHQTLAEVRSLRRTLLDEDLKKDSGPAK
jgi:hypothetical protein